MICWKRYSDAPKPPTTRTFCKASVNSIPLDRQSRNLTYLQEPVLRLDGNDLVPHKLQNSIDHRLEALQNFLVCESHVTFLDTRLRELGFDANINSPLLAVIPEVGLDSVLEVHDALGVNLAGSLRAIRKFHLTNLRAEDVGEVAVQCCRAARVTRTCRALCDCERRFFLDLVRDQVDGTTTTIDNENRVVYLQIEQTGLGTEHSCGLWFGDQSKAVIVLVAQEASLDSSCSCRGLASIVPDSRHCKKVSDVALFSVEYFTQALLQLVAHCLAQLEQVIGGDIDFGLSWGKRREVDRVDVGVSGKHEL